MTSAVQRRSSPQAPTARRAQTRERLITAAIAVFAERGVIGASVEEICDGAGFTRGAFYSNFAGKDDLVLGILRHFSERDLRRVEEITEELIANRELRGNPPGRLIRLALSRMFGDVPDQRNEILVRQEIDLYAARRPELRQAYQEYQRELERQIAALIGGALQAIGVEFAIDDQLAIRLLHGCASRVQLDAVLEGTQVDVEPMEVLITSIGRPVDGAERLDRKT